MATSVPEAVGHHARFQCASCGEAAGWIWLASPADAVSATGRPALQALAELDILERPEGQAALVVDTFFVLTSHPLSGDRIELAAQAISDADASALYRLSHSYAPFHCSECVASYCGSHWVWREFDDDPFKGIEGHCPRGHFHVLAY
ncbi:hypothetical protein [Mycobacterium sp. 1423905.2]|uniref:hypothetical protein n=1 Tax=Mycobacterium sp. 1423905.2 TaxID=1856859 RepID=UPI00080212E7|nr:hypothetical protein [Mycobacterium sp. 1423905.2]OBJ56186.1 hypothetical protein A9W95_14280 [Mycobacterium sp. 1423905.2]